MPHIDEIKQLENQFSGDIINAKTIKDLQKIKIRFLGRKGLLQGFYKALKDFPPEERPTAGKILNEFRDKVNKELDDREILLLQGNETEKELFDYTLPGIRLLRGQIHPINQIIHEISSILKRMGFLVVEGPEIEKDYYNFEALNIPKEHPARDLQDTFYISDNFLLRTHTSPVQIHVMENQPPPIRIIAPGRVFRRDTPDATHSPIFYQVEGLYVDKGVTFSDLKGVIREFARALMGRDINIRFRPSYFPFVEPGAEYDFSCFFCKGTGCSICKGTGWIEISGAGMVHPRVFENVNIDPEIYSGFAFGMGIERIFMLKYGVSDIRLFYENDLRFLNQF